MTEHLTASTGPGDEKHPLVHDPAPQVRRCADADEVARRAATSLVGTLLRVQAVGRTPSVVLTGGGIADRMHRAVLEVPDADLVDWAQVDVWWGDERYVPADSPDRNSGQAAAALLSRLPFSPDRVHPMPPSDGEYGDDVEAAAAAYAAELTGHAPDDGPWFDVVMLGVGPDGHCASLFPGRAELRDPAPVLAVHSSPKPPPTRISLGMSTLSRSREVWFLVSGSEKAEVVAAAVAGADPTDVPAAGPHGSERTLWFVDGDAAWML